MNKLKASIIEKIDHKMPKPAEFKTLKKKITYTWFAPKYKHMKPWIKFSCAFVSMFVISICLFAYFNEGFISEPNIKDSVNDMELLSWDDNVYCLGKTIYIDYPMLTTCCNIEDKITFSDIYWEVYQDDQQIDKSNIPLSFGVNSFTICEKSIESDKELYNLNILVGRDIEKLDINLVHNFEEISADNLSEQIVSFKTFEMFEKFVIDNKLDLSQLITYDEHYFEYNELLLVVTKNSLNELTYQTIDDLLNVTLIVDQSNDLVAYLIPLENTYESTLSNVEIFHFNIE